MSVTVSATPFLLFSVVSTAISEIIQTGLTKSTQVNQLNNNVHVEDTIMSEICNKEFDTIIMDKATLLKTLEEHGATNITENNDCISCECDSFQLDFYKQNDEPYKVRVGYYKQEGLEELMTDLGTEYSTNAQELSYNKIIERLEAQNLTIENEEIYEDDTIVLTVNLE